MSKDQAFDADLQEDPQKSIRKGFVWIGVASTISQILSALTMFILMFFLEKDEIGTATIAVAFGAIFESFNSLGTNSAVVQDKHLTLNETHSVFWFASLFGVIAYIIVMPAAWIMSSVYHLELLVPLVLFMMIKTPLVSIASIPLQIINRRFEFEKISAMQAVMTIISSVLKILLAMLGFGAWSIVAGEVSYGIGTLIFAFGFSRYIPSFHFRWHEIKRFVIYGIKSTASNSLDQLTRNLHYMIVGKFLGEGVLGVYRIAYEMAMTPALALFSVVTKSSFPIFSRLQDKRSDLSKLFTWNQKNLAIFAAVPSIFILFSAGDIFNLMPNESWRATTPIIPFVLVLSFIKSILQTYPDLYRACGKPEWPIYFQAAEAVLILVLCSGVLYFCPTSWSLYAMLGVWTLILLSFVWPHRIVANCMIDIDMNRIVHSIKDGVLLMLCGCILSALPWYYRGYLPYPNVSHIIIELIIVMGCIWGYARYVLHMSVKTLFKRRVEADKRAQKASKR